MGDIAQRLGVTTKSLGDWQKKYGSTSHQHQTISDQLRRVTEKRNILKEAAVSSNESKKSTHP